MKSEYITIQQINRNRIDIVVWLNIYYWMLIGKKKKQKQKKLSFL